MKKMMMDDDCEDSQCMTMVKMEMDDDGEDNDEWL